MTVKKVTKAPATASEAAAGQERESQKPLTLSEAVMSGIKGKSLTVHPVGYWVAVQVQQVNKTAGGIILPEAKANDQRWATVIAVGDGDLSGDKKHPLPLKEGDLVCLSPNRGEPVTVGPFNLVIINYRDVLFALRDGDGQPLNLDL